MAEYNAQKALGLAQSKRYLSPGFKVKSYAYESQLRWHIFCELRCTGWQCTFNPDSRYVRGTGFPDIMAYREGKVVAIECKMPGNKVSREQGGWLNALADAGIETHIIYPADVEKLNHLVMEVEDDNGNL